MNKTVKIVLFSLVGIIALPLIIALFLKKEYTVEREVTINKPTPAVFDYIKHLKNQDEYSVWAKMDTNMKKEYRGTDATVGFVSAWDSENDQVGKGEQEIKKITEGQRIDFELRFMKPFESTEQAYMTTETVAGGTKVKWGFNGKLFYPMNFMTLFMDIEGMIAKDLETGLVNMKANLEKE